MYSYHANSGNQIINGGQHLKESNTEYVKDKNVSKDRRKSSAGFKQPASNLYQQEQTMLSKNFNKENMGLMKKQEFLQQHNRNFTNKNFSIDKKDNSDRYMSKSGRNLRKRSNDDSHRIREEKGYLNNNNRKNSTKNQYHNSKIATSASYSERKYSPAMENSKYQLSTQQQLEPQKHQQFNGNGIYGNVHTEIVEQPTLMELECVAGFDGGLPQYFFLEAYDSRTKKLRLNITSALNDIPLFRIDLAGEFIFPFLFFIY